MSQLVYVVVMLGLNYQLQFERWHVVLVLASDSDLKFKVKKNIGLNLGHGKLHITGCFF